MWKWFRKFLTALFGVVSLFLIYVAFQPADFKISRSIEIDAAPEKIFAHIISAEKIIAWSPWLSLDEDAVVTYEGPKEGVGSKAHWKGNEDLGEGTLEIIESIDDTSVKLQLEFKMANSTTNLSDIILTPAAPEAGTAVHPTRVEWSMYGKNNFLGRLAFVMYDMDKLIGAPFDTGLAKLQALVEEKKSEN